MLDHALLSSTLGYLSILCWLGAQFPQIIVNIRTKSVEGLALPFLANWLFGDITNLIGCVLTHQLPFQTYLASYFVFVDISLVAQYIYYYKPPPPPSPLSEEDDDFSRSSVAMTLTPTAVLYSPRTLTRPSSRTPLLVGELEAGYGYRTYGVRSRRFSGVLSSYPPAGLLPSADEVRAKGKEKGRQGSGASMGSRPSLGSLRHRVEKAVIGHPKEEEAGNAVDEEGLPSMLDSFYSDISAAGGATSAASAAAGDSGMRRHISWSRSLLNSPLDETPGENTPRQGIVPPSTTARHPDTVASTSAIPMDEQEQQLLMAEEIRKRSRSRGRASRRARPAPLLVYELASPGPDTGSGSGGGGALDRSEGALSAQQLMFVRESERQREGESKSRSRRRSASIVFLSMGFGALLAFGGSGGGGSSGSPPGGEKGKSVGRGRVLNWDVPTATTTTTVLQPSWGPSWISQGLVEPGENSPGYGDSPASASAEMPSLRRTPPPIESAVTSWRRRRREQRPHEPPPLTPEQKRRLVGRISAWACTTLYLTSRLPQIWKNYTRKSVQGLSLALFVFAFLGNAFYVSSILSSPILWGSPPNNQPISVNPTAASAAVVGLEAPDDAARAHAFLRESLPYLLGSGGTLLFDVVIVTQGIIYGRRERLAAEEEEEEEEEEGEGEEEDGGGGGEDGNDVNGEGSNENYVVIKRTKAPGGSVSIGAMDALKSDSDDIKT